MAETSEKRFVVVSRSDERVPECEQSDFGWAVYDTKRNEVVGCDGGEPEDQLLVRDWGWVAVALNAVAEENDAIAFAARREERARIVKQIRLVAEEWLAQGRKMSHRALNEAADLIEREADR